MPLIKRVPVQTIVTTVSKSIEPPTPRHFVVPPPAFTMQVRELIDGLPRIGHTQSKSYLKAMCVPSSPRRFVMFHGFWLMFRPAYQPIAAPEGHAKISAILVMTPTEQRHDPDDMPCLRLDDPDTRNWEEPVVNWTDKLARIYTPMSPLSLNWIAQPDTV